MFRVMNFLSNVSQMIIQTTNWYVFEKKINYSNANDSFEIKLTEQLASDKVCNDICRREREYLVAHSLLSDSLMY